METTGDKIENVPRAVQVRISVTSSMSEQFTMEQDKLVKNSHIYREDCPCLSGHTPSIECGEGLLDLAVIIPVYNEEEAIAGVIDDWCAMLDSLSIHYVLAAYNDGSKDGTKEALSEARDRHAGKVCIVNKQNGGHGPTILQGYREYAPKCKWIFQVDSDNEMRADGFSRLWEEREEHDFLLGRRNGRVQPLARKIVSAVSRLVVRIFYGKNTVWDVNAPYRLMRVEAFASLFAKIPSNTFAPNVIISGYVAKARLRYAQFDVPHTNRQTGEVSIKKWKLLKSAARSFVQTVLFSCK